MSEAQFRRGLRSAARGLWVGALTYDQAWDAMSTTIRNRLTDAWNQGAADLTAWTTNNTFVSAGTGGLFGLGGFSLGNPGGDGLPGVAANTNF